MSATNRMDNPFIRYANPTAGIARRVMDLRDPITNALIRLIDDSPFSAPGITDIFRISNKSAARTEAGNASVDSARATLKITVKYI